MNQVSSFLENIIAVEDSQNPVPARPLSEQARRPSLASMEIPVLDNPDSDTDSDAETAEADSPRDPLVTHQGKVADFWYLEDDQKKVQNQLTDRIMEKVLSVMLSTELQPALSKDPRNCVHKTRPPLSVHLMSINTTQMAQKTLPVFELLDEVAFSAGWYNPWHTLGVTMIATLLILRPYLATTIPSLVLLKRFLLPSYLKLYAPDPSVVDNKYIFQNPALHEGAPLGKFEPPKQISQFLREFIMNFTDLQNHMVLYIRLYDVLVAWGQHYFLFENLPLSSVVFLMLIGSMVFNAVALPYLMPLFLKVIPIKAILVLFLWLMVAISHPYVRRKVLDALDTEDAREARRDRTHRLENALMRVVTEDEPVMEVVREAEVFELHALSPNKIWEPIGFTSDFFTLNHPRRHSQELSAETEENDLQPMPSPTSANSADHTTTSNAEEESINNIFRKATLSEVKPPRFWRFAEQQWQIDLDPVLWVNANYIMDLVNVDTDEKWVYDYVDNEDSCDGQVFRRRRWVRQCVRDAELIREKDMALGVTSSERLSKTFSTLLL